MADITVSADIHAFLQTASDALARTELGVDAAGTDNSTDVTLSGTGTYISIAGQVITVDGITESDITDLGTYLTDLTGDALSTVSDVTITAIATGEILKWSGTAWINNTLAEAGISATSHTHTASDVTDFDTEVGNNTAVAANTAKTGITAQQASDITANNAKVTYDDAAAVSANTSKVTNATHTGDVTGATVLTIAAGAVDLAMLSATGTASGTTFLRGDNTWATPAAGGAVDSVNTQTGVVVLDADDISDAATTNKFATAAELSAISANTAKTTNATHTGDVTGDGALTVASVAVTGQTLVTAVGTDHVLIADASDAGNLKKALISDFASAGGDMAASTYDPATIGEQLVGLTSTQTLTNKTLTTPSGIVTDDVTESTDKNYVTDAEAVIIGNTSGTNTGDEAAASDTVSGTVELATIAEVDTGTDTVRAITPAGLAGSALQTKVDGVEALADVTDATNVNAAGAVMESDFTPAHSIVAQQSGTGSPSMVSIGTNALVGRTTGGGTDIQGLTATEVRTLLNVEDGADVTDATNVTAAGALMDSEVTNLAQVKAFDTTDYATAAQGTTADAALPKTGGAMTGAITTNSTFDGRDVATDGSKLDTITVADITANTAKVSNATHTGDVTGSTALTIAVGAVDIPMLSATGTASSSTFLRGDNTWGTPAGGGSGVALSEDVTQSNTFSVGDVIYHNGTSWLDANANTEATAESLGIVEAATGSDFTVILSGKITLTGLTAGTTYFLSDVTPALLTATEPTSIGSISKPVLYAISTTVGYVHNYRGIEIAGSSTTKGQLGITIDGAGSAITTGIKGDLRVPYDCTISNVEVVLDQIGSIVIDVWNDSYANYPAIDGDSITASAPPTVSSATKSRDSTLTGWTLALSAGDYLRFNVDSITTATRATLTLEVTKT